MTRFFVSKKTGLRQTVPFTCIMPPAYFFVFFGLFQLITAMTLQGYREDSELNGMTVDRAHKAYLYGDKGFVIPVRFRTDRQKNEPLLGRLFQCYLQNLKDPTDQVHEECVGAFMAKINSMPVSAVEQEGTLWKRYAFEGPLRELAHSLASSMGSEKFKSIIPELESAALCQGSSESQQMAKWMPLSRLLHGLGGYQSIWKWREALQHDVVSDTEVVVDIRGE